MKKRHTMLIGAGVLALLLVSSPRFWAKAVGTPELTPWVEFTMNGKPIPPGHVFELPPYTPPEDGVYEITYVSVERRNGETHLKFGMRRPSTGADWIMLDVADFNMKENQWFGENSVIRIANGGKDIIVVGDKQRHLPKPLALK